MVWAYATLGYVLPEEALQATAERVLGRLEHFTPQQLANLSWGWAKMSSMPKSLQEGIASVSLQKLPHFKAQELFNLAYAFATIRYAALTTKEHIGHVTLLDQDGPCLFP